MGEIITVALAKGRLAERSVEMLEKCGIRCKHILEPSRKLVFFDESGQYRFIFVKPSDVPTYVEYGVADIGVVGKDTLLEEDRNIYELLDLNIAKCRLCLAGYADYEARRTSSDLRVATKYVNIAKKYFDQKGVNVEIIPLHGSIELGPIIDLTDIILDIVESGKTLIENNLTVLEEVCKVSARLVVNKVSLKTKADIIKPLVDSMAKIVEK